MNKVYVITSGSYSDYGINAIFLNKEKAEAFCKIANGRGSDWDEKRIEEWELKDDSINIMSAEREYFTCTINLSNGFMEAPKKQNAIDHRISFVALDPWDEKCIIAHSLESAKHAEKIAIEQYQIYTQQKLENDGITPELKQPEKTKEEKLKELYFQTQEMSEKQSQRADKYEVALKKIANFFEPMNKGNYKSIQNVEDLSNALEMQKAVWIIEMKKIADEVLKECRDDDR